MQRRPLQFRTDDDTIKRIRTLIPYIARHEWTRVVRPEHLTVSDAIRHLIGQSIEQMEIRAWAMMPELREKIEQHSPQFPRSRQEREF